jgi:hypothetical protein
MIKGNVDDETLFQIIAWYKVNNLDNKSQNLNLTISKSIQLNSQKYINPELNNNNKSFSL